MKPWQIVCLVIGVLAVVFYFVDRERQQDFEADKAQASVVHQDFNRATLLFKDGLDSLSSHEPDLDTAERDFSDAALLFESGSEYGYAMDYSFSEKVDDVNSLP